MGKQDAYSVFAARLFSQLIDKHLSLFMWMKRDIKRANMDTMLREYVSICLLNTLLAVPVSLAVLYFFLVVLMDIKNGPFFTLILAAAATLGTFMVSLYYPAIVAGERKRNIDNNLPFACLYMNTIAGTGAPPLVIFKLLADFKEYGEVSKEAEEIVEDLEVMGQDIETALKRSAHQTPSEEFQDLLWGMITTIVRGGDLRSLLQVKSQMLMDKYRRDMDTYTNDISMYVEVYITVVIVGSIFSLVMMTIMGSISGFIGLRAIQEVMVYVFLPVASIMFIVLLKVASPIG